MPFFPSRHLRDFCFAKSFGMQIFIFAKTERNAKCRTSNRNKKTEIKTRRCKATQNLVADDIDIFTFNRLKENRKVFFNFEPKIEKKQQKKSCSHTAFGIDRRTKECNEIDECIETKERQTNDRRRKEKRPR